MNTNEFPPDFTNAVLPRIYPWSHSKNTIILQTLYSYAKKSGFTGDYDDFKSKFGAYVDIISPADITDIDKYKGAYHITPLMNIAQVLETKGKLLSDNIIIDSIPADLLNDKEMYTGRYRVTPLPFLDQILRTNDKIMEDNVIVEKIPYYETSNTAGGYTVIIG